MFEQEADAWSVLEGMLRNDWTPRFQPVCARFVDQPNELPVRG